MYGTDEVVTQLIPLSTDRRCRLCQFNCTVSILTHRGIAATSAFYSHALDMEVQRQCLHSAEINSTSIRHFSDFGNSKGKNGISLISLYFLFVTINNTVSVRDREADNALI